MVSSYLYGSNHIQSKAIFGGFSRIVYPKTGNVGRVKPSLECPNQSDAFQVSNEQAKLKHKVGLITADEVLLAGMTFRSNGGLYDEDNFGAADRALLRPVVSLKAGTMFAKGAGTVVWGNGTSDNPFIVE